MGHVPRETVHCADSCIPPFDSRSHAARVRFHAKHRLQHGSLHAQAVCGAPSAVPGPAWTPCFSMANTAEVWRNRSMKVLHRATRQCVSRETLPNRLSPRPGESPSWYSNQGRHPSPLPPQRFPWNTTGLSLRRLPISNDHHVLLERSGDAARPPSS